MNVFVVRHGYTALNKSGVRQGAEGPLDQKGVEQARLLGERLAAKELDIILSSPYTRAQETARIISEATGTHYLTDDSLSEVRYPSEVLGKRKGSSEDESIVGQVKDIYSDPRWRYSDEEGYEDFMQRAKAALEGVARSGYRNVVLVTHQRLAHALAARVLLGGLLTPVLYTTMADSLWADNASLTLFTYEKDEKKWTLVTWNDTNHLKGLS